MKQLVSRDRIVVVLVFLGAALLSLDALRAFSLTQPSVIPEETIIPREWLALVWAGVIDLCWITGILGIQKNRQDYRAWAAFFIGAAMSVSFQVFGSQEMDTLSIAARAVPTTILTLAVIVLDLGPQQEKVKKRKQDPALLRARKWLHAGVPELVPDVPVAQAQAQPGPGPGPTLAQAHDGPGPEVGQVWPNSGPGPGPTLAQAHDGPGPLLAQAQAQSGPGPGPTLAQAQTRPRPRSGPGPQLSTAQKRKVKMWFEQEKSGRWMAQELGLNDSDRRRLLGPYLVELRAISMTQPTLNGSQPKELVT